MGFLNSIDVVFNEVQERQVARDGILSFGLKFLDDSMIGILKNDLILVGAGSGGGKTQFCVNVALANVANGKRVHYIALEAEPKEIERRIKYQLFAKAFFGDPDRPPGTISFQNWMLGDFIQSHALYEAQACRDFTKIAETLFTFYKADKFDVDDLIQTATSCADETDLIILDHVHYMDYEENNENRAIKEIAKTARTLALEMGKPIILVSHVRKSDKGNNHFAPGIEEFHGSSDLYKIATKAITLGPGNVNEKKEIETYVRVVKNRFDGSVTRYIGKCFYSQQRGKYEQKYIIGSAFQNRDASFEQYSYNLYPEWGEYYSESSSNSGNDSKATLKSFANKGRSRPV